jgi:hypothetical protein
MASEITLRSRLQPNNSPSVVAAEATTNNGETPMKWSPAENDRLLNGLKIYGKQWSKVAKLVKTRNGKQCRIRWERIKDRTELIESLEWTSEELDFLKRETFNKVFAFLI